MKAWNGIGTANMLAGLGELRAIGRLKSALETRQMGKLLGVPPQQLEEEMLAAGDININKASNPGPWIAFGLVVAVVIWLTAKQPTSSATPAPVAPTTVTASPSVPTTTTPASPPQRGHDFIEFYTP